MRKTPLQELDMRALQNDLDIIVAQATALLQEVEGGLALSRSWQGAVVGAKKRAQWDVEGAERNQWNIMMKILERIKKEALTLKEHHKNLIETDQTKFFIDFFTLLLLVTQELDAKQPLPLGWQITMSRSRPGQYSYMNIHTNEKISWWPGYPAKNQSGESQDIINQKAPDVPLWYDADLRFNQKQARANLWNSKRLRNPKSKQRDKKGEPIKSPSAVAETKRNLEKLVIEACNKHVEPFLDKQNRDEIVKEAQKILRSGSYTLVVNPAKTITTEEKAELLKQVAKIGAPVAGPVALSEDLAQNMRGMSPAEARRVGAQEMWKQTLPAGFGGRRRTKRKKRRTKRKKRRRRRRTRRRRTRRRRTRRRRTRRRR